MQRFFLVGAVLLVGCKHAPPPLPPPPPPPPKGDLLRFAAKPGETRRCHVKLTVEQERAAKEGSAASAQKPIAFSFEFGTEEEVSAVTSEAITVNVRIVDAVGQGSAGTDTRRLDEMALAFDELRIQFKRQPRGEVVSLGLSGLRKPLDESIARQVLNALYGAQRGAIFPEGKVDVGATWKTTMPLPTGSGFAGEVRYDYTYARKSGSVATILSEGRFAGARPGPVGQKLSGTSSAEYRFDAATGKLLASRVDQLNQDESVVDAGANPGTGRAPLEVGVRQHIRVEWSAADDQGDKEP